MPCVQTNHLNLSEDMLLAYTARVVRLKTHFAVQHVLLSISWVNRANCSSLRVAAERRVQFTMILTDGPTVPLVCKISTVSVHIPCGNHYY